MRFEHPFALILFLIVPVLVLLFRYQANWKKKTEERLGDPLLIKQLTDSHAPQKAKLKFLFRLVAIILLIIGLANLQQIASEENVSRKGIDIVLALDVSNSMRTEDVQPDRLQRAKMLINALINKRMNDRMGFMLFAGHAYLQMPLSTDRSALSMYVQTASPEAVPTQGTVLAEALRSAQYAFDQNDKKYKAVVLISDGENHESEALPTAKELKEEGIVLYTIGVGTSPGEILKDPETKQPKLNKDGQPIVSKLNEPLLVELAQQNGGAYYFLTDVYSVADKLSGELDSLGKKEIKDKSQFQYASYFQWFLGVGFILLIIEFLISERRRVK